MIPEWGLRRDPQENLKRFIRTGLNPFTPPDPRFYEYERFRNRGDR